MRKRTQRLQAINEALQRRTRKETDYSCLNLDELMLLSRYVRDREGVPSYPFIYTEAHRSRLREIERKLNAGGPPAPEPPDISMENEKVLTFFEQRLLSKARAYLGGHLCLATPPPAPTDAEWQLLETIYEKLYRCTAEKTTGCVKPSEVATWTNSGRR